MSSITTRKDEKIDKSDQHIKKRLTTTQEERSRTETQQQSHKVLTGTLEELAPVMKAEGLRYEAPSRTTYSSVRSQGPPPVPPPKPVPVAATETRKVAYTTGDVVRRPLPVPVLILSPHSAPLILLQHAPRDQSKSFANATSPGMSPHSISPVMGDIVSSSTTSSQTRTVETVTVSVL